MAKLNKRQKANAEKLEQGKVYAAEDAMALLKELPKAKIH